MGSSDDYMVIIMLQFQSTKEKALATLSTMSSAQIVSASALQRPPGVPIHPGMPTPHPGIRAGYPGQPGAPGHPGPWSPPHAVPVSQNIE